MSKNFHLFCAATAICLAGHGCALFDSGNVWKDGHYSLSWIDESDKVSLSYQRSPTSSEPIIESQVFAVGANEKFIVVKQHPGGDKSKKNFYAVARESGNVPGSAPHTIIGPMTFAEFAKKSAELGLPSFSKTLKALE